MTEHDAYAGFLEAFPAYETTELLDAQHHVYLDYTGASLYGESQVREHFELLHAGVYGNPHSVSLTSSASTAVVERARRAVLEWFNASPDDYTAVFTSNCSGALK